MHLFILTQNLTDPLKYLSKDKQTNKQKPLSHIPGSPSPAHLHLALIIPSLGQVLTTATPAPASLHPPPAPPGQGRWQLASSL